MSSDFSIYLLYLHPTYTAIFKFIFSKIDKILQNIKNFFKAELHILHHFLPCK